MPELAIAEINKGLEQFRELFIRYDAEDQFETDELVRRLQEMRESVRRRFEVGQTLDEQLADAVRCENYELAAELRDQLRDNDVAAAASARTRKARGDSGADLSRN